MQQQQQQYNNPSFHGGGSGFKDFNNPSQSITQSQSPSLGGAPPNEWASRASAGYKLMISASVFLFLAFICSVAGPASELPQRVYI